jgi:hypothetical protein
MWSVSLAECFPTLRTVAVPSSSLRTQQNAGLYSADCRGRQAVLLPLYIASNIPAATPVKISTLHRTCYIESALQSSAVPTKSNGFGLQGLKCGSVGG